MSRKHGLLAATALALVALAAPPALAEDYAPGNIGPFPLPAGAAYIDASNVLHIPGTNNGVSGYITVPGATFAPVVPPAAALTLGGATFTPTSSVTNATITQAMAGGPIVLTAPDAPNTDNRQGFVTPMSAHGSYIFKVKDAFPGAGYYSGGLLLLGGSDVSVLSTFYNPGGNTEIVTYQNFTGGSGNRVVGGAAQSAAVPGGIYCKALVFDGSSDTFLIAPTNSAGQCAAWASLGTFPASQFGSTGSIGLFVNALDASGNGGAAAITLQNYEFTTNTNPAAMPTF